MKQITAASEVLAPARTSVAPVGKDDIAVNLSKLIVDVRKSWLCSVSLSTEYDTIVMTARNTGTG